MIKKMSGFRYMSIFTMASLLYILIALLLELPRYYEQNHSYEKLNIATFDLNLFKAAAITFFSFSAHVEILPVYDEL